MVENIPGQMRSTRNILDKFIKKVHHQHLFNPLHHEDGCMSREDGSTRLTKPDTKPDVIFLPKK
jgi:hypothetical protein